MSQERSATPGNDPLKRISEMVARVASQQVLIGALLGASLLLFWLSDRLTHAWPLQFAVLLLGCGIGAAAWFNLRTIHAGVQPGTRGAVDLRRAWSLGQNAFLLAAGWSLAFAGGAALILGWDGVLDGILARPGLLTLAAGVVLVGIGIGRVLALDEPPARGWDAVLRFPLRLAGLPALVLGIGLSVIGTAQTLAPDRVASWIRSLASGWRLGG